MKERANSKKLGASNNMTLEGARLKPELNPNLDAAKVSRNRQGGFVVTGSREDRKSRTKAKISLGGNFGKNK